MCFLSFLSYFLSVKNQDTHRHHILSQQLSLPAMILCSCNATVRDAQITAWIFYLHFRAKEEKCASSSRTWYNPINQPNSIASTKRLCPFTHRWAGSTLTALPLLSPSIYSSSVDLPNVWSVSDSWSIGSVTDYSQFHDHWYASGNKLTFFCFAAFLTATVNHFSTVSALDLNLHNARPDLEGMGHVFLWPQIGKCWHWSQMHLPGDHSPKEAKSTARHLNDTMVNTLQPQIQDLIPDVFCQCNIFAAKAVLRT